MAETNQTPLTTEEAYRVILARVGTRWFHPREVRRELVRAGLTFRQRRELYQALDEERFLEWRWSLCALGFEYKLGLKVKGTAHEFESQQHA